MTAEFTGERVVPGQVDVDLWNEHIARYAFAARLCHNRRVLDAGCGTGYGAAELALHAEHVTGIDLSAEAVLYACEHFARPNIEWLQASATALPFATAAFHLVAAFEVIEHLPDWQSLLEEARRVIAPGGQFIVSTPNKQFYAETRRDSGPNPFHAHEFEYEEFRDALLQVFPSVSMFVEDHTAGVLFRPVASHDGADVRIEPGEHNPRNSSFFIGVCAVASLTSAPTFVYVPRTANLLKERGDHIDRLQKELNTKDDWLAAAQTEHQQLLNLHRSLKDDLEKSNVWAQQLDTRLKAAGERIVQLQAELESQHAAALEVASAYEARLTEANDELVRRTAWAKGVDAQLTTQTAELARAVELLDRAETTVEERTRWALDMQRERDALEAALARFRASRWVRWGRRLGLGPEIHKS